MSRHTFSNHRVDPSLFFRQAGITTVPDGSARASRLATQIQEALGNDHLIWDHPVALWRDRRVVGFLTEPYLAPGNAASRLRGAAQALGPLGWRVGLVRHKGFWSPSSALPVLIAIPLVFESGLAAEIVPGDVDGVAAGAWMKTYRPAGAGPGGGGGGGASGARP